ncbi:MAG: hypothetical protein SWH54_06170 [Thermodesulfobacteriota bacterium]|nr:hypothetical protein [Thermodesulfobacteriota bacterium]
MTDQQTTINIENLTKHLEPMIRRIIREELSNVIKDAPGLFYLNPDMPIYKDMEEIRQRKLNGQIKLYSHNEVWGE